MGSFGWDNTCLLYTSPQWEELKDLYRGVHSLAEKGQVLAASVVREGGAAAAIGRMALGNGVGFSADALLSPGELYALSLIHISGGTAKEAVESALKQYLSLRKKVYGDREKDICLMDMATIGAKAIRQAGGLQDLDESEEINACSIRITAVVNGREEDVYKRQGIASALQQTA